MDTAKFKVIMGVKGKVVEYEVEVPHGKGVQYKELVSGAIVKAFNELQPDPTNSMFLFAKVWHDGMWYHVPAPHEACYDAC